LRCIDEPVTAAELELTALHLLTLQADFIGLMDRLGLNPAPKAL
jgi:hypothetical protein